MKGQSISYDVALILYKHWCDWFCMQ